MSSLKTLNANAEVMGRSAALFMNINAAKGLYDVMKTNLGPKGTIKMLVGGAGGEFKSFTNTAVSRSLHELEPKCEVASCLSMSCSRQPKGPRPVTMPYTLLFSRRYQAYQGWKRTSPGDADPEPHCCDDRPHCCHSG